MSALKTELESSTLGHRLARKRFLNACEVHWRSLRGRVLLPQAARLDLPFARSDDKYTFCHWLESALGEDAPRFVGELSHLWREVCNVSQLGKDKACAWRSLPVDSRNVPKGSQHFWKRAVSIYRRARDLLGYLVLYEYLEVYSYTGFARVPCYVFLPSKWASIGVPTECAALLVPCVS